MKSNNEIFDLLSLLKVFDANYASDEDCEVLNDLDANNPDDVSKAVDVLLISEFRSYLPTVQARLKELLRSRLDNSAEDFAQLFDRVELVFASSVADRRAFMRALLKGLEDSGKS
ncbi:hypothetical protein [Pseudoduganella sp. R-43]|uniref:hypothetical protein n=1 Tax=Pseudoduganella sp. R-43 TaxID=3404063 RepID=UPI003CFADEAB